MRLVQIWLRALPIGPNTRQILIELARHLYSVFELVLEHAQRYIDTLLDIDFGDGTLVHVGVGLHRLNEIGNAP